MCSIVQQQQQQQQQLRVVAFIPCCRRRGRCGRLGRWRRPNWGQNGHRFGAAAKGCAIALASCRPSDKERQSQRICFVISLALAAPVGLISSALEAKLVATLWPALPQNLE